MPAFRTFKEQALLLLSRGMESSQGLSQEQLCCEIERRLKYINYYRLSAYWYNKRQFEGLCSPPVRLNQFTDGTYWEDVWKYYLFDRRLRALLFDATSRIEIALRTQIAYQWARLSVCDTPQKFFNQYKIDGKKGEKSFRISIFLDKINDYYQNSQADCAVHYRDVKHIGHAQDLPLWVFVEFTTFGNLSLLLRNGLKATVQKAIAKEFGFENVLAFTSAVSLLREVRNACAHHERMWNRRWLDRRKFPCLSRDKDERWAYCYCPHTSQWQKSKEGSPICVDYSKCASLLTLCCRMINSAAPQSEWRNRALCLIKDAGIESIEIELGFTSPHWRKHPFWQPH